MMALLPAAGLIGWDEPSDEHWVRTTEAWFVVRHDQRGAMGHSKHRHMATVCRPADRAADFRQRHKLKNLGEYLGGAFKSFHSAMNEIQETDKDIRKNDSRND